MECSTLARRGSLAPAVWRLASAGAILEGMSDARSYHRWQFRLGALRVLITAGYLAALLASGVAARLRDLLAAWTSHWWLAVPCAVIILAAGHQLLTFPLGDRKSTRLNSSHIQKSRMPSSA